MYIKYVWWIIVCQLTRLMATSATTMPAVAAEKTVTANTTRNTVHLVHVGFACIPPTAAPPIRRPGTGADT